MLLTSRKFTLIFLCCCLAIASTGCATYYQKMFRFQEHFASGDIEEAARFLEKNKKAAKSKDRLLYFFSEGVVKQMLGEYEESNAAFEEAYLFTEDYQKNYAVEFASFLTNPMIKPYRGEDFEVVQIHYYKALNFLRLGKLEEAMVECRRLDIKINQLNDRYSNRKNRYRRDAFVLNLMGIIFEAGGEINNAFVSYRNAYDAYREIYREYFGVSAPLQLKKDLLRTAYLNGFTEELAQYQNEFDLEYIPRKNSGGELVFFLNNGLGPVKSEWSINFFLVKGEGGSIIFVNDEMDISVPFFLDGEDDATKLEDLKAVRITFPKYRERRPYYRQAEMRIDGKAYPLEVAQNLNEIAFKTLEDRMMREFGASLLRLAFKQAAEHVARKKNEGLGTLISLVNAITEKADTRNWQTLPYDISYARIPLPEGENTVELKSHAPDGGEFSEQFRFDIQKGETVFYLYHTLESFP